MYLTLVSFTVRREMICEVLNKHSTARR